MPSQIADSLVNMSSDRIETSVFEHVSIDLDTFTKTTVTYNSDWESSMVLENMSKNFTTWEQKNSTVFLATKVSTETKPGYIYNGKKTLTKRFLVTVTNHIKSVDVHSHVHIKNQYSLGSTPLHEICMKDHGIYMTMHEAIQNCSLESAIWLCKNTRVYMDMSRDYVVTEENRQVLEHLFMNAASISCKIPMEIVTKDNVRSLVEKSVYGPENFLHHHPDVDVSILQEMLPLIGDQSLGFANLARSTHENIKMLLEHNKFYKLDYLSHPVCFDAAYECGLIQKEYQITLGTIEDAMWYKNLPDEKKKYVDVQVNIRTLLGKNRYPVLCALVKECFLDLSEQKYFHLLSAEEKRMVKAGNFTYVLTGNPDDLPAE